MYLALLYSYSLTLYTLYTFFTLALYSLPWYIPILEVDYMRQMRTSEHQHTFDLFIYSILLFSILSTLLYPLPSTPPLLLTPYPPTLMHVSSQHHANPASSSPHFLAQRRPHALHNAISRWLNISHTGVRVSSPLRHRPVLPVSKSVVAVAFLSVVAGLQSFFFFISSSCIQTLSLRMLGPCF